MVDAAPFLRWIGAFLIDSVVYYETLPDVLSSVSYDAFLFRNCCTNCEISYLFDYCLVGVRVAADFLDPVVIVLTVLVSGSVCILLFHFLSGCSVIGVDFFLVRFCLNGI